MKLLTKISGIIVLLTIIGLLVFFTVIFIDNNESDRLISIFLLIPIYFISHFLIRYKLGFNNEKEIESKYEKLLYILMVGFLSFILLFASIITLIYFKDKIQSEKLLTIYSVPKKWGADTTIYNLTATLNTKYDRNTIYYKLSVRSDSSNRMHLDNISTYIIKFMDKDGFIVDDISVNQFTRYINSEGSTIGHEANSQEYFDLGKYSKIKSWDLEVKDN